MVTVYGVVGGVWCWCAVGRVGWVGRVARSLIPIGSVAMETTAPWRHELQCACAEEGILDLEILIRLLYLDYVQTFSKTSSTTACTASSHTSIACKLFPRKPSYRESPQKYSRHTTAVLTCLVVKDGCYGNHVQLLIMRFSSRKVISLSRIIVSINLPTTNVRLIFL